MYPAPVDPDRRGRVPLGSPQGSFRQIGGTEDRTYPLVLRGFAAICLDGDLWAPKRKD